MEPLKEIPTYEYFVHTWGGFYNKEHKEKHKQEEGSRWFPNKEERDVYVKSLEYLSKQLNAKMVIVHIAEGYNTRNLPCIHRVVEYKGSRIYSFNQWYWPDTASTLEYHLKYKWYPGFNDYAVQNAFPDEEINWEEVKIVQEWLTGDFEVESDGS